MKTLSLAAAAATACLVGAAVAAPASGSPDGTLQLTATTADTSRYPSLVDVSGDADATAATQDIGDYLVLLNTLSGRGTDGSSRSAGQFTVIEPATGLRAANVTLELPGGQITLSGFVRLNEEVNTLAVTGGTGRYVRAQGQMTFDRKQGPVNHYVLRLRT